jgi:2-methylaconitate cis-trans-isomerase PrpF
MKIPCVIMRGGTSKAVLVRASDLPTDSEIRNKVLLNILGSPDKRQIDGLGGATSSTSKIAIISMCKDSGADVDYLFGQVSVEEALIDFSGNSGNTASAVGVYAVQEGYVPAHEPSTAVRIRNVNSRKVMVVHVPVKEGKVLERGDYYIPGVPGRGARIAVEFLSPAGSSTGSLLPTGKPREELSVGGNPITVSMVDAANPVVFVRASDVGLQGTELPEQLNRDESLLRRLELIRQKARAQMNIEGRLSEGGFESLSLPQIAIVSPPADYSTSESFEIKVEDIDFAARACSMQKVHQTYMGTCAVCTSVAANIPGTIVSGLAGNKRLDWVRIGHPYGVMDVDVKLTQKEGRIVIERVALGRTARRILDGFVYV